MGLFLSLSAFQGQTRLGTLFFSLALEKWVGGAWAHSRPCPLRDRRGRKEKTFFPLTQTGRDQAVIFVVRRPFLSLCHPTMRARPGTSFCLPAHTHTHTHTKGEEPPSYSPPPTLSLAGWSEGRAERGNSDRLLGGGMKRRGREKSPSSSSSIHRKTAAFIVAFFLLLFRLCPGGRRGGGGVRRRTSARNSISAGGGGGGRDQRSPPERERRTKCISLSSPKAAKHTHVNAIGRVRAGIFSPGFIDWL